MTYVTLKQLSVEWAGVYRFYRRTKGPSESSVNISLAQSLNGPQGSIAANTIGSVKLIKWGLERLGTWIWCYQSSQLHDIGCWKPAFSCPSDHKSEVSTALQYARDFGSTAKESLKRTTAWLAYYYTRRGSWYPVPERSLGLFEIPSMSDSGQGFQRRNLHDEGVGKIAWIFCTAKTCATSYHGKGWNSARLLHQKEIEVGERIDLSSNSLATTDISSVSSIADTED